MKSDLEVLQVISLFSFFLVTIIHHPALGFGFSCEGSPVDCTGVRNCVASSKGSEIPHLCNLNLKSGSVYIIPESAIQECIKGKKTKVYSLPFHQFENRDCEFQCPDISERYDKCMLEKGKGTPKHLIGVLDRTCRRDACQPKD